jgi:hypothetical protein
MSKFVILTIYFSGCVLYPDSKTGCFSTIKCSFQNAWRLRGGEGALGAKRVTHGASPEKITGPPDTRVAGDASVFTSLSEF